MTLSDIIKLKFTNAKIEDAPKKTLHHYLSFNGGVGPVKLAGIIGEIDYVKYIEDLKSHEGKPRRKSTNIKTMVSNYTRTLSGVSLHNSPLSRVNLNTKTVLYTYSNLASEFNYTGVSSNMNNWYNAISTMLYNIEDISEDNLDNIIYMDLPYENKTAEWFDSNKDKPYVRLRKEINSGELMFLMELHRFLNGEASSFDQLEQDTIEKTTIVWNGGNGRKLIFNLTLLTSIDDVEGEHSDRLRLLRMKKITNKNVLNTFVPSLTTITKVEDERDIPLEKKVNKSVNFQGSLIKPMEDKTKESLSETKDVYNHLYKKIDSAYEEGEITASKRTRLINTMNKNKWIYENKERTEEEVILKPIEMPVSSKALVPDKSMLNNSVEAFDSKYVKNFLNDDISNVIRGVSKSGIIISDVTDELVEDVLGKKRIIKLSFNPIDGEKTTVRMSIPVINEEGYYENNGVKKRIRKQINEVPIRKISPGGVKLTSYYGNLFITRSVLAVDSEERYLDRVLSKMTIDKNNTFKAIKNNVFDQKNDTPLLYSKIASLFSDIIHDDFKLNFDYSKRSSMLKKGDKLSNVEKNGILVGLSKEGEYITLVDSTFYFNGVKAGNIYDLLELDWRKAPKDIAVFKLMGKSVPVLIFLAYSLGLSELIKVLNIKVDVLKPKERIEGDYNNSFVFEDSKLVIRSGPPESLMVINGLAKYVKTLKTLSISDMDEPDIYQMLLETKGLAARHINEISLMYEYFLDPMTINKLKVMKEPTEIKSLFIRACELLTTAESPRANDAKLMLLRGYERIPGAIYSEIINSIRKLNQSNNQSRKTIDMSNYAVWQAIDGDPATKTIEDTNPLHYLKEMEAITLSGQGGRDNQVLTITARRYDPNNLGLISEASVDSGSVGLNSFLTPNAQIGNIYGFNGSELKTTSENPAAAFGTSYLVHPFADSEDPKRANFITTMATHLISGKGYELPYVRSGYETVVPHRTGKLFSTMAKVKGTVTKLDKDVIIVTDKDGNSTGVKLGYVYGVAEGSYYPHRIRTDLSLGDKVKVGDPIAYNENFFEIDPMTNALTYKQSKLVSVMLVEGDETYEDSCSVSSTIETGLSTTIAKMKSIVIDFEEDVDSVVKVGDEVNVDSPLLVILDEITSGNGLFVDTEKLKEISQQVPKSDYKGTISKIEVYYNGDINDMMPNVKKLAVKSDAMIKKLSKSLGDNVTSGRVTSDYGINGNPLLANKLEIRIFMLVERGVETGTKVVISNQLKATVSEVYTDKITTMDGDPVEAKFSWISIGARMVISPLLIGILSKFLRRLPNKLNDIYNGGDDKF